MWWLARGEEAIGATDRWLTPAEADRAAAMRFGKRRGEYLLRRLVAKYAVAAVAGVPSQHNGLARIEVRNAPTGEPLVFVDGEPCGLDISISDRAGWAVCVVSTVGPVGCDVEVIEHRSAGFVRDFLTEREREYVAAQSDDDARQVAANLLWSAKESALKVLRTGLGRDTRSVEVTIHHGPSGRWAPMTVRTAEGPTLPGWWRRDRRFVLTAAAARPAPAPVALEVTASLTAAEPRHSWLAEAVNGRTVGRFPAPR
jgi:4'-phosphopantetheinyl transferase